MILDIFNADINQPGQKNISHMMVKSDYGEIESLYSFQPFPKELEELDFIQFSNNSSTGMVDRIEKFDKTLKPGEKELVNMEMRQTVYEKSMEMSQMMKVSWN